MRNSSLRMGEGSSRSSTVFAGVSAADVCVVAAQDQAATRQTTDAAESGSCISPLTLERNLRAAWVEPFDGK